MVTPGTEVAARSAMRALKEEARKRAASVEMASEDHEFYVGIMTAADDHLHPENLAVHGDKWLSLHAVAFADGYAKTSILLATAGSNPPQRLPFPARD